MNKKWLLGASVGVLLICVVGMEIGFVTGKAEVLVLLASAVTALLYSVMKPRRETVGNGDSGQQMLELETPGFKGKVRGMGNGSVLALILGLTLVQAWFIYDMRQMLQKVIDSNDALTYAISLPQAERENLKMTMPESLRRKIRQRE